MASPINLEVGLSGSSSSAADSGHSTFGDFIVGGGKNTAPGWVWPLALVLAAFIAWKLLKR